MVLSPGDCNVCGEVGGRVIFLVAEHDGTVFLACNSCMAASHASEFRDRWHADGRQAIEQFAPKGFRPATETEVSAEGYELQHVRRMKDEEFELFS